MPGEPLRDYSLAGPSSRAAVAAGLAAAEWYHTEIPRREMKALMQRSDGPAIRDTLLWFALLAASAAGGVHFDGSWLALPFFALYGVLYGSASDSRWHECGHGTAFRTFWMNDMVYQLASFMVMRESEVTRWSHARHHTDTLIVGRDPEIAVKRPPNLPLILLSFLAVGGVCNSIVSMVRHSLGRLTGEERDFIPEAARAKVFTTARVWLVIHLGTVALSLLLRSWIPVLLIGVLPTMYGAWLARLFDLTQHAGLAEDVLDHRLNSRTVMMNPLFRFVYWNMNYHVEHHMFPMVPYHALPHLHEMMKHDTPVPYPSLWAAYREIVPTVFRQARDPYHHVERILPPTAKPYRHELHDLAVMPQPVQ
ncbi:fatty acid desaturase family protein [Mesorhizobium sp. L-8-3]|uniref:fatty acid desaturase family protein n=1 Tax=Mesorhizobium sp. L-8-3 TaxID=2744522 RepID=UPI001926BDEE|nr:fatty acid desaturase family protein [Mesorhizobium sp. L-8-3]BCH25647.1 fatty acid desaturase [Mesorhizobium sp. L-8-3]